MNSYLALPLFFLIVLLLILLIYRRRRTPALRSIAAFDRLPHQMSRAAESGQSLHFSLGTGGVGGSDTVASLVGLSTLAYLAEQGVATGTPPLVTVSNTALLPLAQNVLRQAYIQRGRRDDFSWGQVRLISPAPMAYALGTMDILSRESVLANVMLGAFGPEVALIAHAGAAAGLMQIAGSDDPQALAVLYASDDTLVVGEELYATDAYLDRVPAKLLSLVAEDVVRLVLILYIIIFAALRMAGVP